MTRPGLPSLYFILAAALTLSGCDTLGIKPAPAPAPAKPAPAPRPAPLPAAPPAAPAGPNAEQLALRDGIELYNKGSYNDAIKRLHSPDITNGSRPGQVAAAKYSAFSYCVTGRQTLCRQQFEKAFKLDPGFDLAPGERGHPLWGPMFAKARKNSKR